MQSKFSFNIFVQCHQRRVDYEDRAEMKVGGMRELQQHMKLSEMFHVGQVMPVVHCAW